MIPTYGLILKVGQFVVGQEKDVSLREKFGLMSDIATGYDSLPDHVEPFIFKTLDCKIGNDGQARHDHGRWR